MLKNKDGKTPRLLAKDNEHKDALKECRKAEKQSAKLAKGGSRTGEPYAIRVSLCSQTFQDSFFLFFPVDSPYIPSCFNLSTRVTSPQQQQPQK